MELTATREGELDDAADNGKLSSFFSLSSIFNAKIWKVAADNDNLNSVFFRFVAFLMRMFEKWKEVNCELQGAVFPFFFLKNGIQSTHIVIRAKATFVKLHVTMSFVSFNPAIQPLNLTTQNESNNPFVFHVSFTVRGTHYWTSSNQGLGSAGGDQWVGRRDYFIEPLFGECE